jgi:DNA-binding IclR family transcriptional regulator
MDYVRSVERAIYILKSIGNSDNGLTVSELSKKLNLHTTTIIRLLATIEKEGMVIRNPDTLSYNLGPAIFDMVSATIKQQEISEIAAPYMNDLAKETKETISLFVINGNARICIKRVEGLHPVRWHISIGDSAPLGVSSSGKLLLAYANNSLISKITKQPLFLIDGTPVEHDALMLELEQIRTKGFAISFCENSADGAGVSAPVRLSNGHVVASLTLLGPVNRVNSEKLGYYTSKVVDAAHKISERL